MKMTINSDELVRALSATAPFTGTAVPACNAVRIGAGRDGASFSATDMEATARVSAVAAVDEPGACLLPARKLLALAKTLADCAVELEADDHVASVRAAGAAFDLPALPSADFPWVAEAPEGGLEVDAALLARRLRAVGPFCAREEGICGPSVMCVELTVGGGGEVMAVGTDSYRVMRSGEADGEPVVLPPRMRSMMAALPEGACRIALEDAKVHLVAPGIAYSARRVASQYPNWRQLVRPESPVRCRVSCAELRAAVARAESVAANAEPVRLSLSPGGVAVTLSGVGGSFRERVAAAGSGECEIWVNHSYLSGTLAAFDGDVDLCADGPVKALQVEGGDGLAVVMPVRSPR